MNNKERKMFAKYGMQRVRQEHTPRLPVKFVGEMAVWDHREPESKEEGSGWVVPENPPVPAEAVRLGEVERKSKGDKIK